ncbi:MAG: hypothetical protein ACRD18_05065, partial [Terriglobia bacterium]
FDLPAALDQAHQAPQGVGGGKIAKGIFRRFLFSFGPLRQQPNFLVGRLAFVKAVRGLDAPSGKARVQPSLGAFPPTDGLPDFGLLRQLADRVGDFMGKRLLEGR